MEVEEDNKNLKSKALKGILWGGLSNATQQLLGLIFGLYLARNLSDEEYGIVGLLTVFSLIASAIQESGFINALANKKDITHKDYNAVFWVNIMLSIGLYLILFFAAPFIALYFKTPELTVLARVLFLSFICGSFGIVHSAYLFKNLKVKERALATTLAVFIAGIVAIVLVHFNFSYWSLVAQSITYSACFASICMYFSDFKPSLKIDFSPIASMWKFSSKILASNIVNVINNNILTLFFGRFFTKAIVGNYAQADKWSKMPQGIIANMSHGFAQPLLAQFENDADKQNQIFIKLLRFICFLTFPALALLSIISKEFIYISIGEKWQSAVPLLEILCLNAAFLPLINYYSNYFLSRGASQVYMVHNIAYGIAQIIILITLRNQPINYIVTAISIFTAIWTFVWQISITRYSKISYATLSTILLSHLGTALTAAATAYLLTELITTNIYLALCLKVIIFALIYLSSHLLLKSVILNELISIVKKKICK